MVSRVDAVPRSSRLTSKLIEANALYLNFDSNRLQLGRDETTVPEQCRSMGLSRSTV
jgi:hypothetical protein